MVSWSTGKDAAWTLHELREKGIEVVGLVTTVTREFHRVSVHGTPIEVARAQADAVGLPLHEVPIPYPCPNARYEAAMRRAFGLLADEWGATHVAFGDLFLEDVRRYREHLMEDCGLEPLFPLWGRDTAGLARQMLDAGVEAVIVSAPPESPAAPSVGRQWDEAVLDLDGADPCGERGEFHTCVLRAPGLGRIEASVGRVVHRPEGVFADLELAR